MVPHPKTTGLRYWMLRVLEECDHASAGFRADPVHDLRVALRRCRSLADGMVALDPDPAWKAMKKSGRSLFRSLGALRDTQIMMEWIEKLAPMTRSSLAQASAVRTTVTPAFLPASEAEQTEAGTRLTEPPASSTDEPVSDPCHALLAILRQRETVQKHEARAALGQFDRKQWRQWAKSLPIRASRFRPGSAVFKHLALERWATARELQTRAMRNRSQVALHTLRIGIKRFRYIVENFLPAEHKLWSNDLKHMQDLLGEVHDLDVFWATAISCHAFHGSQSRKVWHERIKQERTKRIEAYRKRMVGPDSLWDLWRAGLPHGKRVRQIATDRLKLWARALDPDFSHSEHVARLALELYDGLHSIGLLQNVSEMILKGTGFRPRRPEPTRTRALAPEGNLFGEMRNNGSGSKTPISEARAALYFAALLHDVGKAVGNKGHPKTSQSFIRKHAVPFGLSADVMQQAAAIARFHSGPLPAPSHKALRDLLPDEKKRIIRLAAILRLANAFDAEHDGSIRRVRVNAPLSQLRTPDNFPRRSVSKRRIDGFVRKMPSFAKNEALVIEAEGYQAGGLTAQAIARERYLLESLLRRPILVKPYKAPHLVR